MVEVINTPIQQASSMTSQFGGVTIHWEVIIPIAILAIIGGIILTIIIMVLSKIVKKIRANKKIKEDLEFRKYALDLKNAFLNKNQKFKYKSPLTLWLMWSKAKVYLRTSRGRKFLGYYDGELVKKEGYFIMAIELRYSFFKRETDLVIFPYKLIDKLVMYNDDRTIDIEAEGIDETLSSEYFSIPVFKNTADEEKKKMFTDFSNEVMENYFKEYVYRDVLKNNMVDFSKNIHEATEMNATVPYKRKTGNDLAE